MKKATIRKETPAERRRARRGRKAEGGFSIVEFSLVIPILMLAAVGAVDISRAIWAKNALANATREGVRWASVRSSETVSPANAQNIVSAVRTKAVGLSADHVDVVANWQPQNTPGGTVRVEATYRFRPVFPFVPQEEIVLTGAASRVISF